MATRIGVNVSCKHPLTTLTIAFTKTSREIPFTLLEQEGNANDATVSLLQVSIMLLNIFRNSFSRSYSSVLGSNIIRKASLNYWKQGRIETNDIRAYKPLIWLNPCLRVAGDCIVCTKKASFLKKRSLHESANLSINLTTLTTLLREWSL